MLGFDQAPSHKGCVTTVSDFRRIALSMPATEELTGMGYPNFRTAGKSFATIEDTMVVIRLTRERKLVDQVDTNLTVLSGRGHYIGLAHNLHRLARLIALQK